MVVCVCNFVRYNIPIIGTRGLTKPTLLAGPILPFVRRITPYLGRHIVHACIMRRIFIFGCCVSGLLIKCRNEMITQHFVSFGVVVQRR